tara:strand:- start:430 stop:783 length:354 start_codon:yes stop_codon:yes gene_type:complete
MSKEKEDLEKLAKFLSDNGIELNMTEEKDNYVDYDKDEITVHKRQSDKRIVFTLLHELGHYFSELPLDPYCSVSQIIEEVLAWQAGMDIAESAGIEIDEEAYIKFMVECVGLYIGEK